MQEIPGKAVSEFLLKVKDINLKISEQIEPTDNHSAEFQALITWYGRSAKLTTGIVSVRSDSQIVVMAVEKEFVKNDMHKEYLAKILDIIKHVRLLFHQMDSR